MPAGAWLAVICYNSFTSDNLRLKVINIISHPCTQLPSLKLAPSDKRLNSNIVLFCRLSFYYFYKKINDCLQNWTLHFIVVIDSISSISKELKEINSYNRVSSLWKETGQQSQFTILLVRYIIYIYIFGVSVCI